MESTLNRNTAYYNMIDKLSDRRKLVYHMINQFPNASAVDVSRETMLPINEITGRITELKEMFLIIETGSKTNHHSKQKNTTYQVVKDENIRIDLINAAYIAFRDKRDKLIRDYQAEVSGYTKKIILKEIRKVKSKIKKLDKVFL